MTATHDPTIVRMAELSRLADAWFDADNKLRAYLSRIAAFDEVIDNDVARDMHIEAEAAKQRYFEAAGVTSVADIRKATRP
jgi:hypothetical protein